MKSERGSRKRACSWSARARCSTGRSRGSWMESAAVITSTSRRQPRRSASRIIRARRGSIGSRASLRPMPVRRGGAPVFAEEAGTSAPSSSSSCTPARTALLSGGSTNGNCPTCPSPSEVICRITLASDVRRISGSVNSGRATKSSSLNSRIAMPASTRPQRPDRCCAEAWLIGSMGRRWTLVLDDQRLILASPVSITPVMPGTVREVSATLVASTTRRRVCRSNTRCCSAEESLENSGTMSKPLGPSARRLSTSAVSRISRSPGRNTRMSPAVSDKSSLTASSIASVWSRRTGSPSSSS